MFFFNLLSLSKLFHYSVTKLTHKKNGNRQKAVIILICLKIEYTIWAKRFLYVYWEYTWHWLIWFSNRTTKHFICASFLPPFLMPIPDSIIKWNGAVFLSLFCVVFCSYIAVKWVLMVMKNKVMLRRKFFHQTIHVMRLLWSSCYPDSTFTYSFLTVHWEEIVSSSISVYLIRRSTLLSRCWPHFQISIILLPGEYPFEKLFYWDLLVQQVTSIIEICNESISSRRMHLSYVNFCFLRDWYELFMSLWRLWK